jgi:hypothetical protein
MADEAFALATNNFDKIAFGGASKKVQVQNVDIKDGELAF